MNRKGWFYLLFLFWLVIISSILVLMSGYPRETTRQDEVMINYFEEQRTEEIEVPFWRNSQIMVNYRFNGSVTMGLEVRNFKNEETALIILNNTVLAKRLVFGEEKFVFQEPGILRLRFIFRLPNINDSDPLSSFIYMKKAVITYHVQCIEEPLSRDNEALLLFGVSLVMLLLGFLINYSFSRKEGEEEPHEIITEGNDKTERVLLKLKRSRGTLGYWEPYLFHLYPDRLLVGSLFFGFILVGLYGLTSSYPKTPLLVDTLVIQFMSDAPIKRNLLKIVYSGTFAIFVIFGVDYFSMSFSHFWSYQGIRKGLYVQTLVMSISTVFVFYLVLNVVFLSLFVPLFYGNVSLRIALFFELSLLQLMSLSIIITQEGILIKNMVKTPIQSIFVFSIFQLLVETVFSSSVFSFSRLFELWEEHMTFQKMMVVLFQLFGLNVLIMVVLFFSFNRLRGVSYE